MPAGARSDRVRVVDGEATTHQRVHEVDRGPAQVHRAEVIDNNPHALGFDDLIALVGRFLDRHPVLQSGATTRRYEHAQRVIRRALLIQEGLQLVHGLISY